jgi:hypothetical protein
MIPRCDGVLLMSTTSLLGAVVLCFVGGAAYADTPALSPTESAKTELVKNSHLDTLFALGEESPWSWKALEEYAYTDGSGLVRNTSDSFPSQVMARRHVTESETAPVDMAPPFPAEIATTKGFHTVDTETTFALGQQSPWSWNALGDYIYVDGRGLARKGADEQRGGRGP